MLDMNPPAGVTPEQQRKNLDLLGSLNAIHKQRHPDHDELDARIQSYELAFRMQTEMPGVVDLSKEPVSTLELYGVGDPNPEVDAIAKRCLLARRMVEAGVRFVQVIVGGWDSHDYIENAHGTRITAIDKPMAGLMKDLKRTGACSKRPWWFGRGNSVARPTTACEGEARLGAAITTPRRCLCG